MKKQKQVNFKQCHSFQIGTPSCFLAYNSGGTTTTYPAFCPPAIPQPVRIGGTTSDDFLKLGTSQGILIHKPCVIE